MRDMLEVLRDLPKECAIRHITTGEAILLRRGQKGYFPFPALKNDRMIEEFNAERNVTPAQLEAMEVGSHFGFDCPGADPKTYETKLVIKKETA